MKNRNEPGFRLFESRNISADSSVITHKSNSLRSIIAISLLAIITMIAAPVHGETWDSQENLTIKLDTLTGPNGFRIEGLDKGDQAGRSINLAGDINHDGFDDYIIGAPAANPEGVQGAGEVYIIFGGITNPASFPVANLNGINGFRVTGGTYYDETGYAVSGAGDVNNDGYDDVLIGAPGADPTEDLMEAGSAYVIFGRGSFSPTVNLGSLNGSDGFRINGIIADDRTGSSVGSAGDVNGDGFDDLIIGATDASPGGKMQAGQAFIVFGRVTYPPVFELSGLNGSNGFQVSGNDAGSNVGKTVNSAGDFNGDGYGDFLLTAGYFLTTRSLESGIVYVIFGNPSFTAKFNLKDINGTNGVQIEGIANGDNSGRAAAAAGDVNGDGRDDLIIGAPYASDRRGEAYVVFGHDSYSKSLPLDGLNGTNGFRVVGNNDEGEESGEAGTAVGAADINGDGLEDVIIGVSLAGKGSTRFAGKVYVLLGATSFAPVLTLGSPDNNGLELLGVTAGDQAGKSISTAGDINGDGFDEFLIGAPNAGPAIKSDLGYVYLIQGGPTLGLTLPVTHPGSPSNDNINGTSGKDIILGGRGNDQVNAMANNDTIKGGAGDDIMTGETGSDRHFGGNGEDTVSYSGSVGGVSINLFTGETSGGDASGDYLRSVERIIGSSANDTLIGDTSANLLEGGPGDDTLTGGKGDDAFRYSTASGHDTIADFVSGAGSDDYLDFTTNAAITGIHDLNISVSGLDTLITLPSGDTIKLLNVAKSTLHADDYRFKGAPYARDDFYTITVNKTLDVPAPGVLANDENPAASPLTAHIVNLPNNGTVTLQSNGSFSYKPNKNFVGHDEFTYLADNGQPSNEGHVSIEVTLTQPVARDDAYTVKLGETLTVPAPGILDNDESAGGPPLEAVLLQEPVDGVLVLNGNGSFSYTPSVDYSSQDSFTYHASNGIPSNVATVTITILDPVGPPVAIDDAYELMEGETLTVPAPGVLGNDVNPLPGSMTATGASSPSHGTLAMKPDGSFTYTPEEGFSGIDSFTYKANNGKMSNPATVTLTVRGEPVSEYRLLLPSILRH